MQLESARSAFEELGAQIVAISTDTPQVAQQTKQELGLSFTVIPDNKRTIMRLYDHKERYTDLNVHNPAVYIVDREGIVRYAHFGKDAGDRPDPSRIIAELKQIVQGR